MEVSDDQTKESEGMNIERTEANAPFSSINYNSNKMTMTTTTTTTSNTNISTTTTTYFRIIISINTMVS